MQTKKEFIATSLFVCFYFCTFVASELSHCSIMMKNSEIQTIAISLPNFQAIRPTDLF